MIELTEIASGLRFPEGPIAMADGSFIVVEIERQTLSRITPNGHIEVIANTDGGPNGAAIGPDGACYVCNNGGFEWTEKNGLLSPGMQPADYIGGRIQRVDLNTGKVEDLYTECDGIGLRGPNDLVFDQTGGFWFTDRGKYRERDRDRTGIFYATPDGNSIEEKVFPMEGPNGIGLSANERVLYVAETPTGKLWAYDLSAPGKLAEGHQPRLMALRPDNHRYDSLAVDSEGNVCVGTLITGGITVHSADGERTEFVPLPDRLATNICFGGEDLKTAYVTLSTTGRLVSMPWHCPGLPLNFLNKMP